MKKVRWGVLGTAKIAKEWLIPAMHNAKNAEVVAVASRTSERAEAYAAECNIPTAIGSYDALLQNNEVDAIYNPMPNHMHVPWSIAAINAGKHVLCEKPLGLDTTDAQKLVDAAADNPNLVVMEAFMYRFHPQWQKIKSLVDSGELGTIKHIQANFSYFNRDASNVRNQAKIGGGGLMDVGCYCISVARFVTGKEPRRVNANLIIDPEFNVDVHTSAQLDFGDSLVTFNCSTQSNATQFVHIIGDKGRIVVDTPFYKREDQPNELVVFRDQSREVIEIGHHNHYLLQVETFSQAVIDNTPAPTPLSDAINNMRVIDGLFISAESGSWQNI